MRLLVVEDEKKMAELLARGLREEGHAVDITDTGQDALWMARSSPYDVIVLDVMLPGGDGVSVCRRLREQKVWTPVLLLTARGAVDDRVTGLDADQVSQLAQPFRRLGADRTGSDHGSGLGLSIVEAIAEAHGGTLELHARPEGGLRVGIALPLAPAGRLAGAGVPG